MPRYTYQCEQCEHRFVTRHSIKEKLLDCTECKNKNVLKRIPSHFTTSISTEDNYKKTGDVVNNSIERFKEELNQEKKRLKQEEFEV